MANMEVLTYTDGIDFWMQDYRHPITREFDSRHWTHKRNGAGIRYLFTTSLYTNKICMISNGYYPSRNTDDVIAHKPGEIVSVLRRFHEKSFADAIFTGPEFITPNGTFSREQCLLLVAQARHENINKRFKEFGILQQTFRNHRDLHGLVVKAIANIVQISLMHERPPMDIRRAIRKYGGSL